MKKRRTLEEVLGSKINAEYSEKYAYIMELVDSGRIKPVLASKKKWQEASSISGILGAGRRAGLFRFEAGAFV